MAKVNFGATKEPAVRPVEGGWMIEPSRVAVMEAARAEAAVVVPRPSPRPSPAPSTRPSRAPSPARTPVSGRSPAASRPGSASSQAVSLAAAARQAERAAAMDAEHHAMILQAATAAADAVGELAWCVPDMQFSADDATLLVARAHELSLWDVGTATCLGALGESAAPLARAKFAPAPWGSPSFTAVSMAPEECAVRLWDVRGGACFATFGPVESESHLSPRRGVDCDVAPEDASAPYVLAAFDREAYVWDLRFVRGGGGGGVLGPDSVPLWRSGSYLQRDIITTAALSPDGRYAAFGDAKGAWHAVDLTTAAPLWGDSSGDAAWATISEAAGAGEPSAGAGASGDYSPASFSVTRAGESFRSTGGGGGGTAAGAFTGRPSPFTVSRSMGGPANVPVAALVWGLKSDHVLVSLACGFAIGYDIDTQLRPPGRPPSADSTRRPLSALAKRPGAPPPPVEDPTLASKTKVLGRLKDADDTPLAKQERYMGRVRFHAFPEREADPALGHNRGLMYQEDGKRFYVATKGSLHCYDATNPRRKRAKRIIGDCLYSMPPLSVGGDRGTPWAPPEGTDRRKPSERIWFEDICLPHSSASNNIIVAHSDGAVRVWHTGVDRAHVTEIMALPPARAYVPAPESAAPSRSPSRVNTARSGGGGSAAPSVRTLASAYDVVARRPSRTLGLQVRVTRDGRVVAAASPTCGLALFVREHVHEDGTEDAYEDPDDEDARAGEGGGGHGDRGDGDGAVEDDGTRAHK